MRPSDPDEAAWLATLGAGLVVALVVTGLLEWLRRTVIGVDEGVSAVWTAGKRVAGNTQTTHLLQGTALQGVALRDELEQHKAPSEEEAP